MPRSSRLDAPGALQHVMVRGIEKREIFRGDRDREDLLSRLSELVPATGTACLAWAFLPNHVHFLFRSGPKGIAYLMRRLLTGYVVSFNRRYQRHGPLFQNRYKSILCEEETYFLELVRYIHLNPVRAGIVSGMKELNRYPYCGHSVLLGERDSEWQEVDCVLRAFGDTRLNARRRYLSFVLKGLSEGRRDDLTGGGLIRSFGGWEKVKLERSRAVGRIKGDERILGGEEFVRQALDRANESLKERSQWRQAGFGLPELAGQAAERFGVTVEEVMTPGRQRHRVKARSLLCFWASEKLGMRAADLARALGMTISGVGYAIERGRNLNEGGVP